MAVNEHDAFGEGGDDARLAALYRSAAVEEPPERLDRLIRDAARAPLQAAAPAPRTPWWQAWRAPVAFAAVAVLSVSLVIVAQREGGEPLTIQYSAPPVVPPVAEAPVRTPSAPAAPPEASASSDTAVSQMRKVEPPAAGTARGSSGGLSAATDGAREQTAQKERFGADESRLGSAASAPAAAPMELPRQRRDAAADRAVRLRGLEGELGEQRRERAAQRAPERAEPERPFAAAPPPPPAPAAPTMVEPKPSPPSASAQTPAVPPRMEARPAPSPPRAPEAFPAAKPLARSPAASAVAPSEGVSVTREQAKATLAALVRDLEDRAPAQWIERIAQLRAQGLREDADALLAEFKRRYPDEPLPFPLQ